MLRALWFLFKLVAAALLLVWIAERPGIVTVEWQGYLIEAALGFVFAVFAGFLLLWTIVYRVWRSIVEIPSALRRYRAAARREKGYRALNTGFLAIAAGDVLAAGKNAETARKLLPDTPLSRLLEAQNAQLQGNAPKARVIFQSLLDDDASAFFGLRGLLQETLALKDYREALTLVRRAEKLQPKRHWVLRLLFEMETRNGEWLKALDTLKKAEKQGVFTKAQALVYRQAALLAFSDQMCASANMDEARRAAEKSFDLDPAYTPAALRFAGLCLKTGRIRQAQRAVETAWRKAPHPDLAHLWAQLRPPLKKKALSSYDDARDAYDWIKKLTSIYPRHRDSERVLGQAAMAAGEWKEARTYLVAAMDYKSLAKLERVETGNEAKASAWLETAAENPPDPRWICDACGHVAEDWHAVCQHCGVFAMMVWMTPSVDVRDGDALPQEILPYAAGADFLPPRI